MFDPDGNYIDNPIRYRKCVSISPNTSAKVVTLSPLRPKFDLDTIQHVIDQLKENLLEFTITFKPELIEKWHEETLCYIVEKTIRRSLRNTSPKTRIILIGEHSAVGRFHYHGIISNIAGDKVAKLQRACRRHLGRCEIKQITYETSYKTYMTKSFRSGDVEHPPTYAKKQVQCYNLEKKMTECIDTQMWNDRYTYILINIDLENIISV